jgi:hypothetical protein
VPVLSATFTSGNINVLTATLPHPKPGNMLRTPSGHMQSFRRRGKNGRHKQGLSGLDLTQELSLSSEKGIHQQAAHGKKKFQCLVVVQLMDPQPPSPLHLHSGQANLVAALRTACGHDMDAERVLTRVLPYCRLGGFFPLPQ